MEHRCGERVTLRLAVELSWNSSMAVAGWVTNVSSSGAFVRTEIPRTPRGPVEVILASGALESSPAARLPAYVVRETQRGLGIEWREFAPRAVREIITNTRVRS